MNCDLPIISLSINTLLESPQIHPLCSLVPQTLTPLTRLRSGPKRLASTQPHAAYAAFTHGLSNHWLYTCRTIPDIQHLLLSLETAIHQPALTG